MAGTVVGSPQGELRIASYYKLARCLIYYIRPQTEENWASRPLCHTQTSDRRVSSWVGDHQRIRAVVCFVFSFYFYFLPGNRLESRVGGMGHLNFCENWRKLASLFGNVDVGANGRPVGRDVYHSNELVHASLTAYAPSDGVEK